MRTIVVTGGTHGIGEELVRHYRAAGNRVIAVGSTVTPGPDTVRTDLSSPVATLRLAASLPDRVDALVLAAFRYSPTRVETADGLEHTFALYVLSRFLLVEALLPALERGTDPAIVNLCGTGLRPRLDWSDLQMARGRYRPMTAVLRGAHANDLLGAAFTSEHPAARARYVLYNPVMVDTGLSKPFHGPTRLLIAAASLLLATPISQAVPPITRLIDSPPAAPLSAFRAGRPSPVDGPTFDPASALRLTALLRDLSGTR
ncbi:SDR family NAD(P)-dependent oxidoreductase [Catenuloplanes sp. NPDC051500]|uniref:SDR family NAD(P)-dependent oxidoreductase n=1 Tax=Catenuloplanes sp. NPDC051500 TaxID=3363959 RepID=UPI00379AC01D